MEQYVNRRQEETGRISDGSRNDIGMPQTTCLHHLNILAELPTLLSHVFLVTVYVRLYLGPGPW